MAQAVAVGVLGQRLAPIVTEVRQFLVPPQVRPREAGEGTGPHIAAIGNIPTSNIDSAFDPLTLTTSGAGLTDMDAHWFLSGSSHAILNATATAFTGIF
jgi:hypothetical protein